MASIRLRRGGWLLALWGWVLPAWAGEPEVRNVSVRGLQVGGTTTLVVDGEELGSSPRLLLPFPAKQSLKPGGTPRQAAFEVALDANVTPGYAHLRVATDGGVSLPVVIGVDRLPQRPLAASAEQLPVALHGSATGSTPVETKFTGKAGQKVMAEVEAGRLGSRLRPVVHLYGPKRLQLAWAWPTASLSGDARLEATLPADGVYTVSVHDVEYAGPSPGFFRLKIGQWSQVDQVFPPVVDKSTQAVELIGPAAGRLNLPASRGPGVLPLAWPGNGTWSGPRPFVTVGAGTEVVEQAPVDKGQPLPEGQVGVSGRLLAAFEEDRYRVPVKPASRVRFEVFAERLGSPLDVGLVVRNEAGGEVARAEDGQGTLDPSLEYAVPDKVTAVVVGVVDVLGRGGPRGVYRLVVEPKQQAGADFQLVTPARRLSLPTDGFAVVPVLVERRGYQGGVTLAADGLPAGVTLDGATIPAGADGTLVTVRRSGAATAAIATWRGRAEDGQERTVLLRGHPLERLQPWLATELAVAPTAAKGADFQLDWRGLTADVGLVPARKLGLPVKLTRPADNNVVRLTLLTSQLPPLVNNQPDPNRGLRAERPAELAAKAVEGELSMLVPADLPAPSYDVAVQAELLAADRRTVLATAFTPVRRLTVRMPLVVLLDGAARVEAKAGTTVEIKGKVERREGLTGDVTLALTGLPPGVRADGLSVKAGTDPFVVKLVLPPNVPAGEVKGLKLVGTAVADPKQPNVRVKSREVELTLVVGPK